MFRELLDLRLREGERIECCAKTTKQFPKGAVPDHFIDPHCSFLGRRSHNIAIPALEIVINVSENVGSLTKCLPTIGGIKHPNFLPRDKHYKFTYYFLKYRRTNAFLK